MAVGQASPRGGFVIEGTQRAAAFREGELVDLHVMARLHPALGLDD